MSYVTVLKTQENDTEWLPGGEMYNTIREYIPENITHAYGTLPFSVTPSPATPTMPEGLRLILAIFLFTVFVIGVTGNLTVILVLAR